MSVLIKIEYYRNYIDRLNTQIFYRYYMNQSKSGKKKNDDVKINDIKINDIKINDINSSSNVNITGSKSKVNVKITTKSIPETYSVLLENFNVEEETKLDAEEDLFNPDYARLSTKPISLKYQILWDLYKKQEQSFWTSEEIDFSNDYTDFMKFDENVQHFIKMILAFFAGADAIVNNNIREQFSKIKVKEAEIAYGYQQMMENIHGEVYADMLINIVKDEKERNELINAFKTVDSIKRMIGWAQKWSSSGRRIGYTISAFTIFEGLMFSGAFASIYWLKRTKGNGIMEGLTQSNAFIARDEGMHTNFGTLMYGYVKHRLSKDDMTIMMKEAVDISKGFTKDAIRVDLIGMSVDLMNQYIEYVADMLMVYLGYEKIFNSLNPFPFMETIGMLNKDNFFEKRPTEYQRSHNQNNTADWKFKILNDY